MPSGASRDAVRSPTPSHLPFRLRVDARVLAVAANPVALARADAGGGGNLPAGQHGDASRRYPFLIG